LQPGQIAAENWAYPTGLLPRRWSDLNTLKALFYKKAESLGTDTGESGYSVTHAVLADTEPLYSRLATGVTSGYSARSYGDHNIARAQRLPVGSTTVKIVFEAQARLEQTTDCALSVGFTSVNSIEPLAELVQIFYNSTVGANWQSRSYQSAEEQTDLGVAVDTNYHIFHIEVASAAVTFYLDGTLKATHSTQIPQAGLPGYMYRAQAILVTNAAAAKYARYTYVAVWLE